MVTNDRSKGCISGVLIGYDTNSVLRGCVERVFERVC